jgi:hypothetical protein
MNRKFSQIQSWAVEHKKRLLPIAFIVLAAAIALVVISHSTAPSAATNQTPTPSVESPDALTTQYGAEVSSIIEQFEVDGHTIKMYRDPSYHAEVYTGPYLEYIDGYYLSFDESTLWPIVSQATVTKVKVIEYSGEKIRALACVTEEKLDLNYKGKLIAQEPVSTINGAYVFVKADGVWKLANFFDMSKPESAKLEYAMMDDDLRQITGDYESLTGMDCVSAQ